MPKLTIDGRDVEVPAGSTILEAATALGIEIPTMCHTQGRRDRHVSCMVCTVYQEGADGARPGPVPACQFPAMDGMVVDASSEEVRAQRRRILELILSDHIGDCEGPCENTCPAHMAIPVMMRCVSENEPAAGLSTVRADIALPATLGHICPEVCEKACRRQQLDSPVAICRVKRYAGEGMESDPQSLPLPQAGSDSGKRVAVVGAGPAGLAAALYLRVLGHACTVFDAGERPGGALRSDIAEDVLPRAVLDREIGVIDALGVEWRPGWRLGTGMSLDDLRQEYDAVFLALGKREPDELEALGIPVARGKAAANVQTLATSIDGVFCGGDMLRQRKLAVRSVADGKIAAHGIDQHLRGLPITGEPKRFNSRTGKLAVEEVKALVPGEARGEDRQQPAAADGHFSRDEAATEAGRCLHCDCVARDDCTLRDLADAYGAKQTRFKGARRPTRPVLIGDQLVYENGKCIGCGKCVYLCERAGEKVGLAFTNRGFELEVTVPLGQAINEGVVGIVEQVVRECPTGALSLRKDYGGIFS
ncbi:MAG: 2Fe-2S iron-sulfur cluster-binding protein [Planctomycetota bacterium]